jgi:acyl dehydratase
MISNAPADTHDVGDEFAPLEFTVTPELNQQYLFAEADFHPRFYEHGPWGTPIVHPSLLFNMSNITRSPSFHVSPGAAAIHTGEVTTHAATARVGDTVRVTWRVLEKFERRGRPYHVQEAVLTRTDGTILLTRTLWHTYSSAQHAID